MCLPSPKSKNLAAAIAPSDVHRHNKISKQTRLSMLIHNKIKNHQIINPVKIIIIKINTILTQNTNPERRLSKKSLPLLLRKGPAIQLVVFTAQHTFSHRQITGYFSGRNTAMVRQLKEHSRRTTSAVEARSLTGRFFRFYRCTVGRALPLRPLAMRLFTATPFLVNSSAR